MLRIGGSNLLPGAPMDKRKKDSDASKLPAKKPKKKVFQDEYGERKLTYAETVQILHFEAKETLEPEEYEHRMAQVFKDELALTKYDDDETTPTVVHFIGTYGKTSVVSWVENMLSRTSKTFGAFVNPFIFTPREQIRMMDSPIDVKKFVEYFEKLYPLFEKHGSWMHIEDKCLILALELFHSFDLDYMLLELSHTQSKYFKHLPKGLKSPHTIALTALRPGKTSSLAINTPREHVVTTSRQHESLLQKLEAASQIFQLHVVDIQESAPMDEENRLLATNVMSTLTSLKIGYMSKTFIPCRYETILPFKLGGRRTHFVLDGAMDKFQLQKLLYFTHQTVVPQVKRNGHQVRYIAIVGNGTPSMLDYLNEWVSSYGGGEKMLVASARALSLSVPESYLEAVHYMQHYCDSLEPLHNGLDMTTKSALDVMTKQISRFSKEVEVVVLCFGHLYLSAEVRRMLVRRKFLTASKTHPSLYYKNDAYVGLEVDRSLLRYIKLASRRNHYLLKSLSYGWIQQIIAPPYWSSWNKKPLPEQVRYVMGSTLGINHHNTKMLCRDKAATSTILRNYGLPAIEHVLFAAPSRASAMVGSKGVWDAVHEQYKSFGQNVVVKPKVGSEGIGVTHIDHDVMALEDASTSLFASKGDFCMSPFFRLFGEVRVILLHGECLLMYKKVLPCLVGNGKDSLSQLYLNYLLENHQKDFSISKVQRFMSNVVPAKGERFPLQWKFNLSGGASVEPFFDEHVLKLARQAARILQATFVSVDIGLTDDPDHPHVIIEVNSSVWVKKYSLLKGAEGERTAQSIFAKAIEALMQQPHIDPSLFASS